MSNSIIATSRKSWVDALRALAIMFVIFGHSVKNMPIYFIFTSPIKMPLFFAISGYLFSLKNGKWGEFLKGVLLKLIIPWFVLGLLPILFTLPFKGLAYLGNYILLMISGKTLWFMPCLVIAEIIHFAVRKYNKTTLGIVITSIICAIVGLILGSHKILDFAMINRALIVQCFMLIGFLFHEYEGALVMIKWKWVALLALIYVLLCFVSMTIFPGKTMDIHCNKYYNYPLCFTLIILGNLLLFISASKSCVSSKVMSFIGQNTLVIYIWHGYAISLLCLLCNYIFGLAIPCNAWTALLKVVWCCMFCGLCSIVLTRFFPEAVGKKRVGEKFIENRRRKK